MTARRIMLGRTLLAGAMAFALSALAQEQDYPGSPIKIVVPAAPGATTDTWARIIADQLQRKWGQPAIVDNRAGAAGNIGAGYAIKANPDGYTLLFSYPAPLVVNKSLYPKLAHDPAQLCFAGKRHHRPPCGRDVQIAGRSHDRPRAVQEQRSRPDGPVERTGGHDVRGAQLRASATLRRQ